MQDNSGVLSLGELNSVHSVKILLCYLLDRLDRPVTAEQLMLIAEDSGIINYFFFSDALGELAENGSVIISEENGEKLVTLTEKGRKGSEYFNRTIPIVFRKRLLKAAFSFFARLDREAVCRCDVADCENGANVRFSLTDGSETLIDMSFYAPDREQGEMIAEKIAANPVECYKRILGFFLENPEEKIDVEKYL